MTRAEGTISGTTEIFTHEISALVVEYFHILLVVEANSERSVA